MKDYPMTQMTLDLTSSGMLAITRDALNALRGALVRDTGPSAAAYLQEAGYAGGGQLFEGFRQWLSSRGKSAPEALGVEQFQREVTEFFRQAGWGSLHVGALHDSVATVDSIDWGEATPNERLDHPSCHLTTGMFTDFFGRVANAPLAVMEVECRSAGAERCRFLLGSTEVMTPVYDEMSRGTSYETAVAGTR
jgi:predicted hydrocarbon binding protein